MHRSRYKTRSSSWIAPHLTPHLLSLKTHPHYQMSSATECKAKLVVEHKAHLAREQAEQEACYQQKEEEFAKEMAELELKEEEE